MKGFIPPLVRRQADARDTGRIVLRVLDLLLDGELRNELSKVRYYAHLQEDLRNPILTAFALDQGSSVVLQI